MRRWPSYPSLSLIIGPWGSATVQIAGPQLLRNADSHSTLLFRCFCKITSSLSDHSSCENTSWLNTCQKRPGQSTAVPLSCWSSSTDAIHLRANTIPFLPHVFKSFSIKDNYRFLLQCNPPNRRVRGQVQLPRSTGMTNGSSIFLKGILAGHMHADEEPGLSSGKHLMVVLGEIQHPNFADILLFLFF